MLQTEQGGINPKLDLGVGLPLAHFLEIILNPPKAYTPYALLDTLEPGAMGCIEVAYMSMHAGRVLKIQTQAKTTGQTLELICFNHTSYHLKVFRQKSYFVYGKLGTSPYTNALQMTNPKIIDKPNTIAMRFDKDCKKLAAFLKQDQYKTYLDFCLNTLTPQNLRQLESIGVPLEVVQNLCEIFHPTMAFALAYNAHKGLPHPHLQALKYIEALSYMCALKSKTFDFPAKFSQHANTKALQEFLDNLPFKLTPDQQKAIANIQQDMQGFKATKRLVMGDVGCGKTMVILASVALCAPYKSLLMAPTSILAKQIYNEALKYLPASIKPLLLLGGTNGKQKEAFSEADFIVGTTALLYAPLDTSQVALVLSDEQHRFGTKQRHTLQALATQAGSKPHYLQFSATPIPRTLAMMGAKFIATSFLKDKPHTKNIQTRIVDKPQFNALLTHIKAEIAAGKQVAIIYPLVEESENKDYLSLKEGAPYWQKRFENVFVVSGKDKDKEDIMEDFAKKGQLLLATTLIEVGISLPKLSTIVVVGAERLGLATLHQLRGRVARLGGKGYCYLFTHNLTNPRLHDFSQTTDGFEIANLDLKYRHSGDLLEGTQQSGDAFRFLDLSQDAPLVEEVSALF
ncbi:ATP-dependent DNA helicase RecG [Helicobacter ailurogastricus]|uniref:ATP-dependent DNA helicase RecG n=1 Tax=Helicobacter ailurogastricus TaxID=1578720 RepID=UPI000CF18041|nr:ATP-dependent DNA helicase RecG [Helicobacter ailurogastricus]GMB89369.1 ATP-dependent DNA helicase RecG [Helicobacter ailurogastricus]